MNVTIRTERREDGVHYMVARERGGVVWERIVFFGADVAHRAGGYAFREAAKEQARQARLLAGHDDINGERLYEDVRR